MSRYAEVYSSSFRIDAKFSGLRYLMYHYPITTAIFGTSLNLYILTAILILSWYRFFASPLPNEDYDQVYTDPFESNSNNESQSSTGNDTEKDEARVETEENVLGECVEKLKQDSEVDDDIDILPDLHHLKALESRKGILKSK